MFWRLEGPSSTRTRSSRSLCSEQLRTTLLWGQEFHLGNTWRKRSWGFQGFTSIFLHGFGYIVWPLPFQICKPGKKQAQKKVLLKLHLFMVIKTRDVQREATQNVLAATRSRALFLPPRSVWSSPWRSLFNKTERNTKSACLTPEIRISKCYFIHLRSC